MNAVLPAILLIEKDELTLEIYQRELSHSFLVFCSTELDGIPELLKQQHIHAIIIEPEICAGQGWDWINELQGEPSGRDIPIIVCTTRDASRKSSGSPITIYLTKPVLPKTLRERVLGVLASKKR